MKDYLTAPIPRYQGLIGVSLALSTSVFMYVSAKELLTKADEIIADQDERLKIFGETTDFLLDRADNRTIMELNKNLDFWRVVRGVSTKDDEDQS